LKKLISIDIYLDTICPWCYIGQKKLQSAIEECKERNFSTLWRPFQLNPDMPNEGMDRNLYLINKFGGKEQATRSYSYINKTGLENGIHFQFDKIIKTPNSFASHKLLAIAHKFKKQNQIIESLFYSYFIEGLDIGDIDILTKIAKQYKIHDRNTLNYLKSDEDKKSLLNDESQAKSLGVKGVPCFIINKEYVLFGAQDKNKFIEIFNKFDK